MAEMPVVVERTSARRCSMDRKLASARCSMGSTVFPYQESSVRLNMTSGMRRSFPPFIRRRSGTGKMSSYQMLTEIAWDLNRSGSTFSPAQSLPV